MLIDKGGGQISPCSLPNFKEPSSCPLMLEANMVGKASLSVLVASGVALAVSGTAFSAEQHISAGGKGAAGQGEAGNGRGGPSLLVGDGQDVQLQLRLEGYQVMMLDVLEARPHLLLTNPHDLLEN